MQTLRPCAVVCGTDDVASAAALQLVEAGYTVLLAAGAAPAATRGAPSFAAAVKDGEARLDGVRCRRVEDAAAWLRDGAHDIACCAQPLHALLPILEPEVLVGAGIGADAAPLDPSRRAPLMIALDPGAGDGAAPDGADGVLQTILRHGGLPPLARAAVAGVVRNALTGDLALFAATLGFNRHEFRALVAACLPDVEPECEWEAGAYGLCASRAPALFAPLTELLLAHRAPGLAERPARWLAHALAAAGFGARHLWQDLGLSGRAEVSRLLGLCFPTLAARNVTDMKWKRHMFLVLGERLGRPGLMPPNCASCDSYPSCFGLPVPEGFSGDRRAAFPHRDAGRSGKGMTL
jgi:nitrogen fixation protein NifQ